MANNANESSKAGEPMKNMQRIVYAATVCLGLVLVVGCVVDQNGRIAFVPPASVVTPAPVESYQVQIIRQKAGHGDAIAQFTLGSCYANGRGVVRNYAEAARWYRLSAEQGYAVAQNRLGVCYSKGLGVAPNYAVAVEWYRKAAEQGNAFAEDNLGTCYTSGRGVARDYTEAVKWFRPSAGQGCAVAQNHLGICYSKGLGVPQDYAVAVEWFRKAAEQGNLAAKNNLLVSERTNLAVEPPQPNGQTAQNPLTNEPNEGTVQNPPAEQNEATTGNPLTVDEIKMLNSAGVKSNTLINEIKTTNSKFSAQDIVAAQQANVDPAVIECMKSYSN
jgi:hypothetical protein